MAEHRIPPALALGWLPVGPSRRGLTLEHFAVDLDVLLEIGGHILFGEDRRNRTFRLARTAIDAFVRMDVELVRSFIDAIDRAYVDAGSVLGVLAGFGYDVGHFVPGSAVTAAPNGFLCEK
jgi:hypothetical protein